VGCATLSRLGFAECTDGCQTGLLTMTTQVVIGKRKDGEDDDGGGGDDEKRII
jgi:hypothetical protein